MDIDITQLKSREITKILTMYPQGHLEIKFERVFWSSDYSEPDFPRCVPGEAPRVGGHQTPQAGLIGAPARMLDTLGSMMGPAGR